MTHNIMSTKSVLINKLSKEIKIAGFKKAGFIWSCECNSFIYIINIQPGKYIDDTEEYFTIYMGIYSSEIYNLCWGKEIERKIIKETDCCLRGVFSIFTKHKENIFRLKSDVDIKDAKENIINLINNDIVPFLKNITSYEELYKAMVLFENNVIQKELSQIYIACIEFVIDKREQALERLSNIKNAVWANKAKEVMKRMQCE